MEIMNNSISLDREIRKVDGYIICPKCDIGRMLPVYPSERNTDYQCEKCGYRVHCDPVVEVK